MEGYTLKELSQKLDVAEVTVKGWLLKINASDYVISSHKNKRTYSTDIVIALERLCAQSRKKPEKKAHKIRIVKPEENQIKLLPPEGWKPSAVPYEVMIPICDAFAEGISLESACRTMGVYVHSFLAAIMANSRYREYWFKAALKWRVIHAVNLEAGLYAILDKMLTTTQKIKTVSRYKPTPVGIDENGEVIYSRELVEEITTVEDYLPTASELALIKKMIEDIAQVSQTIEAQEKAAPSKMDDAALDAEIRRLEGG